MACISHLVLHCVHFLHWGVIWVACGWFTDFKNWQVGAHKHESHNFYQSSMSGTFKETHPKTLSVSLFHRKKCLLLNNFVAIFGAVLMLLSQRARSFEMIMVGRFLYGINSGSHFSSLFSVTHLRTVSIHAGVCVALLPHKNNF